MFQFLLDILFPKKQTVREIEHMDPVDFAIQAEKPQNFAGKDILSCFDYRDPMVREAIWELKYRGNKQIARLLAAALYDELLAFLEEYAPLRNFTDPLLIPIPLSKSRESERGFNQCKLLCKEMLRLDSSPPILGGAGGGSVGRNFTLSFALHKTKDTLSQTKQDTRKKRLENLKDCFSAEQALVQRRNIILIDDVATTGATLEEARRTLKTAGARHVIAFTVAH